MIAVAGANCKATLLFPTICQQPSPGANATEIPDIEALRARLYQPAWVIIDEFNRDDLTTSYALEEARGAFRRGSC